MEEPKPEQRQLQRVEESTPASGTASVSTADSPGQEASKQRSLRRDERPTLGEQTERPPTPAAANKQQSPGLARKVSSKASVYPSRLSNVSRDAFGD
jgi:hypothetical protein